MSPFNRLYSTLSQPIPIIIIFLIIGLIMGFIDCPLATCLVNWDLHHNFPILNLFTNLGLMIIYVGIFFIVALYFRYKNIELWEARMWFLWLCVISSGALCVVIKILLGRARPIMWFQENFFGFYGLQKHSDFWSFPSGHTTCIMAVAFGFSIIFPRFFYSFIGVGLLVALSRVLLVQHYLSDVLVAIYLTLLEIGCLLWIFRRYVGNNQSFLANNRILCLIKKNIIS